MKYNYNESDIIEADSFAAEGCAITFYSNGFPIAFFGIVDSVKLAV